jgi:hypothetical protein
MEGLDLCVNRTLVAAPRKSAAIVRNQIQRHFSETPLRRGSWPQCAPKTKKGW